MGAITIFHGSPNLVTPRYGVGKKNNDYGLGLYCTEHIEMAKEWACSQDTDGFANEYRLETDGLTVLNLSEPSFNILNWLAILLDNRKFAIADGLPTESKKYILEHFLPSYESFDIIRGYRADDSYFSYANDFVNNTLSLEDLKQAMMLGKLGEQVVLKSRKAFDALSVVNAIPADRSEYYAKYHRRDEEARRKYKEIAMHPFSDNQVYVIDLIRGKICDGDTRL